MATKEVEPSINIIYSKDSQLISILIPTYNYNVLPLVERLCEEVNEMSIDCEILVGDDASPAPPKAHTALHSMPKVDFLISEKNRGRTGMRQWLSEKAKYEHLLFMDADVLPKNKNFISAFVKEMDYQVVFGGIEYLDTPPTKDQMLRWKYGRSRETITASKRQSEPYLTVNSGCFMIDRALFLQTNKLLQMNKYGLDNYFKELLREVNASVRHIENPVYHLGLESNDQFLKKSLEAINTTVYLEQQKLLRDGVRPLQKSYLKLSKFRLTGLFSSCISPMKRRMETNFKSGNPNLFWFDLYRLQYYIQLKRKKDA